LAGGGAAAAARGDCPIPLTLDTVGLHLAEARPTSSTYETAADTSAAEAPQLRQGDAVAAHCTFATTDAGELTISLYDAAHGDALGLVAALSVKAAAVPTDELATFLITASKQRYGVAINAGGTGRAAVVRIPTTDGTSAALLVTSAGQTPAAGDRLDTIAEAVAAQITG